MDQAQLDAAVRALQRLGVSGALRAVDHLELAIEAYQRRGTRWEEQMCYSLREALEEIPLLFGQSPQSQPLVPIAMRFLEDLGDLIDTPADAAPDVDRLRTLMSDFQGSVDDVGADRRVRVARAMMVQARTGQASPQVDSFGKEWAEVVQSANTLLHEGVSSAEIAESLLDRGIALLAALIVPISDRLEEVDALATLREPTEPQVQTITRLLADERLARYFFTQKGTAEWLYPLDEAGFFNSPMRGDWYQGAFLIRVCEAEPVLARDIIGRFTGDTHPAAPGVVAEVVGRLGPGSSSYLEQSLQRSEFGNTWALSHALEGVLEAWSARGETQTFPILADLALEPLPLADSPRTAVGKFPGSEFKSLVTAFVNLCGCADIFKLAQVFGYKVRRVVEISRSDGVLVSMTRDLVDSDEHDDRDVGNALVSGLRDALRRMRDCGEPLEQREVAVGALDNEIAIRIWAGHLAEEEGGQAA